MPSLGHVEGHREREARLADRRACRDDDEIAGGEALGVEVDLAEARGDAAHFVRLLHPLTQVVEVLLQRRLDVPELRVRGFVAQREDALLGAIEYERYVRGLSVCVGRDRRRRAEKAAQDRAVAHDARVPFDLDRSGHKLGELAQIRRPADPIQLLAARELDLHRERVDPFAALEQRLDGPVDALMPREIEVVFPQQVDHFEDRVAVDEETAEHLLLRRLVVRQLPVCVSSECHRSRP